MTADSDATETPNKALESGDRLSTGISGVDTVLNGGVIPRRTVLIRGPPGAGKTLFCLHYLTAGADEDERSLFINFGEPEDYIREDAASWGINLEPVRFLDLTPSEDVFAQMESYELFPAGEVEGRTIVDEVVDSVEDVDPDRVVIDPITQLRYLYADVYQFRKQVMALFRFLKQHGATPIVTSQATTDAPDDDLQFISDAIIHLGLTGDADHANENDHRTIRVSKFRGSDFAGGLHTLRITGDGMRVAPKLVPKTSEREFTAERISSGIPELDELLHGGLERGTLTMVTGPTGAGKTTTGLQFMKEAAGRGELSVLYSFEEGTDTLVHRAESVNIPVQKMRDRGTLQIEEIQPGAMTVDEFSQSVRHEVEGGEVELVMIDGIDGYTKSLRGVTSDETGPITSLGRYLRNMGVTTLLVNELHQVTGEFQATEEGLSYVADNVVFLRHVEFRGELRKVIGVLKKRTSDFEQTLRELEITEHGLKVGDPLPQLRDILSGTPDWSPETEVPE